MQSKNGNLEKARSIFVDAIKMDPISADIWAHLAVTQEKLGLSEEALDSFKRAALLDPTHAESSEHLTALSVRNGEEEGTDGDVAATLTDKAVDLAEGGDLEAALELFQQAAERDPINGKSWENIGVSQMRLGRLSEARVSFTRATTILPRSEESLKEKLAALTTYEEHETLMAMKTEYSDSVEEYDGDGFPDSEDIDKITNAAIARAESGDVIGSLPLFEAAAKNNNKSSQSWQNVGVTQVFVNLMLHCVCLSCLFASFLEFPLFFSGVRPE